VNQQSIITEKINVLYPDNIFTPLKPLGYMIWPGETCWRGWNIVKISSLKEEFSRLITTFNSSCEAVPLDMIDLDRRNISENTNLTSYLRNE